MIITGRLAYFSPFDFLLALWRPLAAVSVVFHLIPHGGIVLHGGNCAALLTIVAAAKPSEVSMKQFTLQTVCRLLGGIRAHRVEYVLANQIVPEPKLKIGGRRIFTLADVRRLAVHFGVTLPAAAALAEPTAEAAGV